MEASFLFKRLLIGFSIAAPVGPIGVLCIKRTLIAGRSSGFVSGIGAATADALYGAVAAFGLTGISYFLIAHSFWLRLVGGVFLAYLGIKALIASSPKAVPAVHRSLIADYLSTVSLTLANPATILAFIAIFAGVGLGEIRPSISAAVLMVVGVFVGSTLWWLILSTGVSALKSRSSSSLLKVANILSGLILLGFALAAFASILSINI